ncbi:MAG: hypothetical protein QW594_02085 [Candidatus Woesearchaeota archaeon]
MGCNHENCNCADVNEQLFSPEQGVLSAEELLYTAHLKTDALLALLIKKGLITEHEYQEAIESLTKMLELAGQEMQTSSGIVKPSENQKTIIFK